MASAWGFSWGVSWGDSWGTIGIEPVPEEPSGGPTYAYAAKKKKVVLKNDIKLAKRKVDNLLKKAVEYDIKKKQLVIEELRRTNAKLDVLIEKYKSYIRYLKRVKEEEELLLYLL